MKENIKENNIKESPIPISLEESLKIINQMKNSICRIYTTENTGTGYFCKINYNSKLIPFLITNNHIINKENIENNKTIKISVCNGEKNNDFKSLIINIGRKICRNEELDVTLIEIKPNVDRIKINSCLELDDDINENNINEKLYNSIYILHYPKDKSISVSYGLISEINGREIKHLCNIEYESSGSPILSLKNLKVIGIHIGIRKNNKLYNKGILIKNVILEMIKKNNKKSKMNEIEILYDNKKNKNIIKIFGNEFVKNNIKNCKLIVIFQIGILQMLLI